MSGGTCRSVMVAAGIAWSLSACGPAGDPGEEGAAAEAIIGGTLVRAGQHPWMVAVLFEDGQGGFYQGCGGALIDSTHVLTAGHCSIEYNYNEAGHFFSVQTARAVSTRVALRPESLASLRPEDLLELRRIRVHPSYDDLTLDFDVAVYELAQPVSLPRYPTLAEVAQTRQWITDRTSVKVLGYGTVDVATGATSDRLRQVNVPLLPNSECAAAYAGLPYTVNGNTVCAGFEAGGKDSCNGDSGGPLFNTVDGNPVLVGIVSTGEGCAEANHPGIYTRVSSFLDYVRACQAGSCGTVNRDQRICQVGYEDCDGNPRNGCEHFVGGAGECGACGAPACGGARQCTFDETTYEFACTRAEPITHEFVCLIPEGNGFVAGFAAHNPNTRGQVIPAGPNNFYSGGASGEITEYFLQGDVGAYAALSGEFPAGWSLRGRVANVPRQNAPVCASPAPAAGAERARGLPRAGFRARLAN